MLAAGGCLPISGSPIYNAACIDLCSHVFCFAGSPGHRLHQAALVVPSAPPAAGAGGWPGPALRALAQHTETLDAADAHLET